MPMISACALRYCAIRPTMTVGCEAEERLRRRAPGLMALVSRPMPSLEGRRARGSALSIVSAKRMAPICEINCSGTGVISGLFGFAAAISPSKSSSASDAEPTDSPEDRLLRSIMIREQTNRVVRYSKKLVTRLASVHQPAQRERTKHRKLILGRNIT